MVILSDSNGNEIKMLTPQSIDFDLNETRDFEIILNINEWSLDFDYGSRIYIPNSEYGGLIGEVKTNTADNTVKIKGFCFRGILSKHIITPPKGYDYKNISGELNSVILALTSGLNPLFQVSNIDTGVSVTNFQFDRYTTLLDGLNKLLKSKNYKLQIKYIQKEQGLPGYAELSAVPINDYSKNIELSQDNRINFTFNNKQNGVNHLICLGSGELKNRVVVDLYVGKNGEITESKYYKGLDEICETYENTGASATELKENGTEKLQELMNTKTFKMDVSSLDIDIEIGDIIGGRDYITGFSMSTPITNKIYTLKNGNISIEYKIEGDDV